MTQLDPVIHVLPASCIGVEEGVDHRVEPGDDDRKETDATNAVKRAVPGWWRLCELDPEN